MKKFPQTPKLPPDTKTPKSQINLRSVTLTPATTTTMTDPRTIHYTELSTIDEYKISESRYQGKNYYFADPRHRIATNWLDSDEKDAYNSVYIFPPNDYGDGGKGMDMRVTLNEAQAQALSEVDEKMARAFEAQQDQFNLPRTAMTVPFLHAVEEHNGQMKLRVKARIGKEQGKNDCRISFIRFREKTSPDDAGVAPVTFTWSDGSKHDELEDGTSGKPDYEATWERAESILRAGGTCCMQLVPNIWASSAGKGVHYKCLKMFVVDANVSGGGDYDCMLRPGRVITASSSGADADANVNEEDDEEMTL